MSDYEVEAAIDVQRATSGRGAELDALKDWNARFSTDVLKTANAVIKLHSLQISVFITDVLICIGGALYAAVLGGYGIILVGIPTVYSVFVVVPIALLVTTLVYRRRSGQIRFDGFENAVEDMVAFRDYVDGLQAVREGERRRSAAVRV